MEKSDMNRAVYVALVPSSLKNKKLTAFFYDKDKKMFKRVHFGQYGASDYTEHKSTERRDLYDNRHMKREDWNNFMSAGSLAKYILWNLPTKEESFKDYLKRFGLKKYSPP
jgi:hypothetical protein